MPKLRIRGAAGCACDLRHIRSDWCREVRSGGTLASPCAGRRPLAKLPAAPLPNHRYSMPILIACGLAGLTLIVACIDAGAFEAAPLVLAQVEGAKQKPQQQKRVRGGMSEQQLLQNPMVQQILRDPELQQQIMD